MKRTMLCLALALLALPAHAALIASARQIAALRISPTLYEYTYQVTVRNTGPAVTNVKAFVASPLPNVTVLDDVSVIGDLDFGLRVTSNDTVRVRVDRSQPYRASDLRWTVGFEARLLLQGAVRSAAGPMAAAQVSVRVDRSGSPRAAAEYGRPVVETVTTVADAGGNYSIEVPVVTDTEFLSLRSAGAGASSHMVFASLLRSAETLLEVARRTGLSPVAPGTYPLTATALTSLDLSSVSTGVAAVFSSAAADGRVDTDAELIAAERAGSAMMVLERAGAIEVVRERGASALPPGVSDTLGLVSDPVAYRDFVASIELDAPGTTTTAAAAAAVALQVPFTRSSARGDWLLLDLDSQFPLAVIRSNTRLNLQGGNVFESTVQTGITGSGTWTVDAMGRVVASYVPAMRVATYFVTKTPCGGSGGTAQIPVEYSLEQHTLVRIWDGAITDQVVNVLRTRTSYPGNPCYDDIVEESLGGIADASTALRTRNALNFDARQLAGRTLGMLVQHPLFGSLASSAYNAPELRYVRLPLLADGTGSVPIRTTSGIQSLDYVWAVTKERDLLIEFADGTSNRVLLVGNSGPFLTAASIAEFPAGSRVSGSMVGTPLIYSDLAPEFETADVADLRFRSRLNYRENLPSFSPKGDAVADFLFRADGRGCLLSGETPASVVQDIRPIFWQVDASGQLDYTRDSPSPTGSDQRRLWRLVAIEERGTSIWYWLDEQLQSYSPGAGQPAPDFSASPGRLTAYEIVGDASGCMLP